MEVNGCICTSIETRKRKVFDAHFPSFAITMVSRLPEQNQIFSSVTSAAPYFFPESVQECFWRCTENSQGQIGERDLPEDGEQPWQ